MRRNLVRRLVGASIAAALAVSLAPTLPADDEIGIRGITISTHGSGADWADAANMRATMKDLQRIGPNWVAIHPYAGIRGDGLVVHRRGRHQAEQTVTEPIRVAHELGLKILIKPHLAYWGSPFRWRGDIRFEDPADKARFWESYSDWIVDLARQSAGADGFAIGTELDGLLEDEAQWKSLIERVRAVTSTPLTYASNWSDFERVTFWKQLDAIGIQAYFPITEEPDPDDESLRAGWKQLTARLNRFSEAQGKPIVFTELGYNQSASAAARPWEHRSEGEERALFQQRCMKIALEAVEAEPAIRGAFLWKWFPLPHPIGRDFQLATHGMREVIRQSWTGR